IVETLIDAILLLAWTLGGGLDLLDRLWSASALPPLATATAVIMSVLVLISLLSLPFSLYRTFVIEERFGFNRTTPGLFVVDHIKGLVLLLLLGTPLVLLVLWIMRTAGAGGG